MYIHFAIKENRQIIDIDFLLHFVFLLTFFSSSFRTGIATALPAPTPSDPRLTLKYVIRVFLYKTIICYYIHKSRKNHIVITYGSPEGTFTSFFTL